MKRNIMVYIDIELIERAKLNKINISKLLEEVLDRRLSLPTISTPDEIDKIDDKIKQKELDFIDMTKEIDDLKAKKKQIEQETAKKLKEKYEWEEL